MSQATDNSVVVSLEEIMRAERDRVRAEADQREKRRAAERAARETAESDRREAEVRRLQQERDRQWRDQWREREELARLEAIRTAEIEKARREAELRAQQEAQQLAQRCGENTVIERLRRQLRALWVALAAAITIVAVASVVAVTLVARRFDERLRDLTTGYATAQDAWARERSALASQIDKAEQRYLAAQEKTEKAERALEALSREKTRVPPAGIKTPPKPPSDDGAIKCQKACPLRGDPLCVECKGG